MHDLMKKLLDKKRSEGKTLSPLEKEAKMGVVDSLKKAAEGAMAEKGLKKITVASDSKSGLEKGLDMAKKMAAKAPEMESSEESSEEESSEMSDEESSESPAEEEAEHAEGGSEDKEAMMAKLQALDSKELEALLSIAQKLKG